MPSSLLRVVNSLFQTCYHNLEPNERGQRQQICNNLFADLAVPTCAFLHQASVEQLIAMQSGKDVGQNQSQFVLDRKMCDVSTSKVPL